MREKKPPSLKDVAALAGVSSATVSRLLNGTLDLPHETKTRIDEAIRSLDYRPNPHARRLSRGRSDTIGLVVPDIANPFFATFVAAVEQEADRHGLAVSLHATLNRTEREIAYLDLIARNHLDGLIFVTNHPDDGTLAARISRSGKVVVVDEDVPGAQAPKIFCDNVQGGLLVGRHLAAFGHRRVLFLGGPPEMISARRRAEGLRRGLDPEAGITVWHGDYTIDFGRAAAQRFLAERRRERAIFATSDEIVIGLMEVFRERGVSVPHDVSIVGFDDVGPLHLFAPAMTAVRQPVSALGTRAVERLLEADWTASADLHQAELMPIELVVRDSVAPPAD